MPLKFGSTTIQKVVYNNTDIRDLIFNGTKVFTKRRVTVNINFDLVWSNKVSQIDTPTVIINVNGVNHTASFTRTRVRNPDETRPSYADRATYTGVFDMIDNSSITITFPSYMHYIRYSNTSTTIAQNNPKVRATSNLADFTITCTAEGYKYYEDGKEHVESEDGVTISTSPTITISQA